MLTNRELSDVVDYRHYYTLIWNEGMTIRQFFDPADTQTKVPKPSTREGSRPETRGFPKAGGSPSNLENIQILKSEASLLVVVV